ncbi:MAG: hypothetical protein EA362_03970 [Saprospirales bacterium]|nr:MAG: hypothetical protein EA362_03970 [Saprospirales bacterium]
MNYRRIIITGPECSGKSSLCKYLSVQFGLNHLDELSIQYLNNVQRSYDFFDLKQIAVVQNQMENNAINSSDSVLICDTSFLVLYIWSSVRFGKVDPFITDGLKERQSELFLLCKPDLNWEAGPYRENPNDRNYLFKQYLEWLIENECEFFIIQGEGSARNLLSRLIVNHKINN